MSSRYFRNMMTTLAALYVSAMVIAAATSANGLIAGIIA